MTVDPGAWGGDPPGPGRVGIDVGEAVLAGLLRRRVPGLEVRIRAEPPEVELSLLLVRLRLRLVGFAAGELILEPVGAASLLARLLGGALAGREEARLEGGRLHVRVLPGGLPPFLRVERLAGGRGFLRLVLAFAAEA